jgi:hypothetical protein
MLTATATDDGLPSPLTYTWSVVSGTGVALFTNPNSSSTQVSFSAAGTYTLRVTVSDGQLSSTAYVVVTVNASNQALPAPTGLSAQCSTSLQTFTVSWNPVPGATHYYVQVDYLPNNINGRWYITDGIDYSVAGYYTQTSFTGTVIPGQPYKWSVYPASPASGIGPSTSANFTCGDATTPVIPTSLVNTPQVIPDVEQGDIRSGYFIVTPDSDSAAPTPAVTFGTVSGGVVQAHSGTFPGPTTMDESFFVEVIPGIGSSLGVAIVNPGSSTNTVSLTLSDTNGTIAASPVTLSLLPYQQSAGFVNELFSSVDVGMAFRGTLRLQSSAPFAALGLQFSGGDFSTLPFVLATTVPSPASRTFIEGSTASTPLAGTVGGPAALVVPQFALSGGWATQIALGNNNGIPITGRVDFLDSQGTPMAVNLNGTVQSTFTYSIPANETFVLAPRDANGQSPF